MAGLGERWRRSIEALCAADPDAADVAGKDLVRRWSAAGRAYHDLAHLVEVLDAIDLLSADVALPPDDVHTVRLAAWFHDTVYDGVPGADERASAALAVEVLSGLGAPASVTEEVARLIELTTDHVVGSGDVRGALLCDADLAVLGRDPEGYATYADAVRREYAHVSEPDFRRGRAQVLTALLAQQPLFRLPAARDRWETRARVNMTAELHRLQQSDAAPPRDPAPS